MCLRSIAQHFLASIQFASTLPDPSPAPHLYLAQLSTPEESLTHFTAALAILQAKLALIERAKLGADGGAGTEEEKEEESEVRRSASRALVGMTELYLTDLWSVVSYVAKYVEHFTLLTARSVCSFEADAEANCEKHLAHAATVDPTDPEVYQVSAAAHSVAPHLIALTRIGVCRRSPQSG